MAEQLEHLYDIWRCSRCQREKTTRSKPHMQPQCCGTGMWWDRFQDGPEYMFDPEA